MRNRRAAVRGFRARTAAIGLSAALLLATSFGAAEAHDQGVLKLTSKTFRSGDSLAIAGSKFSKNDELTLALVGVNGRVALGDVPTDTSGAFRRVVLVPATAAAGQYRLIAEAIDGDQVASLEVAVLAAASGASAAPMAPMPGMEQMPGHEGMQMDPTGEPLALARARNAAVTATAVVLIVACVLAGAGLLQGTRTNHPMEDIR